LNKEGNGKVLRITKIGLFAALYTVASLIPFSIFIGASSLLTLNVIITPIIAIVLSPLDALATSAIGGLLAIWLAPNQAIFGPTTLLLPITGALLGSMLFHKPKIGAPISASMLIVIASLYIMARASFPFWIAPHILAAVSAISSLFMKSIRKKILITALTSTMCEQAAMLIQAVYILQLPSEMFMMAFPFMIYERLIGTLGGFLVIECLIRFIPNYSKMG